MNTEEALEALRNELLYHHTAYDGPVPSHDEAIAALDTIKALLASHADNIEYGQKAAADAYRYHTWFLTVRDERDEARAQLERQEAALRQWEKSYPCPCGAWFDDLSQRPHAPGCPVDAALSTPPNQGDTGNGNDRDRDTDNGTP